jgi:glycerophosphoryl diester phosphodiesterase
VELIAHRAGNHPATLAIAAAVAHAAELDVHRFRRRLEVRHAKVLWPTSILWERWSLVTDAERPTLAEILDRLPADTRLWFDLKGFDRRLTRAVLAETAHLSQITMSSRSWWILSPAYGRGSIRTMRSVGNRTQRWLAELLAGRGGPSGTVLHERLARPATIARLRRQGPVFVWGATGLPRVRELERHGVDGVILDDLGLIRELAAPC